MSSLSSPPPKKQHMDESGDEQPMDVGDVPPTEAQPGPLIPVPEPGSSEETSRSDNFAIPSAAEPTSSGQGSSHSPSTSNGGHTSATSSSGTSSPANGSSRSLAPDFSARCIPYVRPTPAVSDIPLQGNSDEPAGGSQMEVDDVHTPAASNSVMSSSSDKGSVFSELERNGRQFRSDTVWNDLPLQGNSDESSSAISASQSASLPAFSIPELTQPESINRSLGTPFNSSATPSDSGQSASDSQDQVNAPDDQRSISQMSSAVSSARSESSHSSGVGSATSSNPSRAYAPSIPSEGASTDRSDGSLTDRSGNSGPSNPSLASLSDVSRALANDPIPFVIPARKYWEIDSLEDFPIRKAFQSGHPLSVLESYEEPNPSQEPILAQDDETEARNVNEPEFVQLPPGVAPRRDDNPPQPPPPSGGGVC